MNRKLLTGIVAAALTLTTGISVYAAVDSQKPEDKKASYQSEVSMGGEGVLSFDNIDPNNLPEGVTYRDEVSMSGEGAIAFKDMDPNNLPEGATYRDEISMGGENSISFDAIDPDNLPADVFYQDAVDLPTENGKPLPLNP